MDSGMGTCKYPEHFVGESLSDLLNAFEVEDNGLEAIKSCQESFGLRARY